METDRKLIKVTDTVIRYQHEARKVKSFKISKGDNLFFIPYLFNQIIYIQNLSKIRFYKRFND